MKMKVKLQLETMSDISRFVQLCSQVEENVSVTDSIGHCVSAKSLLGMIYAMEWTDVWCECEKDIYFIIKEFVI